MPRSAFTKIPVTCPTPLSLNRHQREAEAEVVVAKAGAAAAPIRRTAVTGVAAPAAATVHAVRAIIITIGTAELCAGIIAFSIPVIQTPFTYITTHII